MRVSEVTKTKLAAPKKPNLIKRNKPKSQTQPKPFTDPKSKQKPKLIAKPKPVIKPVSPQ
jgi:hypothetical protein